MREELLGVFELDHVPIRNIRRISGVKRPLIELDTLGVATRVDEVVER